MEHCVCHSEFQSTLPMRGGTKGLIDLAYRSGISIHPPHAGRDMDLGAFARCKLFQSTLPMRGGTKRKLMLWRYNIFQSTLPMRGGTKGVGTGGGPSFISIHPPHAGRDLRFYSLFLLSIYFNPPSPCGEGRY